MIAQLAQRLGVSTTVAAVILALIATQIALLVYALIDLARRDAVLGDRKWVWALVIAFGNLLGPIVYLLVGRRTPPPVNAPGGASTAGGDAARRAVDSLYGPHEGT
jgi:hypothetical protein